MRVELRVEGEGREAELAAYLTERLQAAWPQSSSQPLAAGIATARAVAGADVRAGTAAGDRGLERRFDVALVSIAPSVFVLVVSEDGLQWASRTFERGEGRDAVALKLEAWLFVRSALLRALAEPTKRGFAPAADAAAVPESLAVAPPPAIASVPGGGQTALAPMLNSAPAGAPATPRYGKTLLVKSVLASAAQSQLGLGARLSMLATARLRLGAELGYLFAPGRAGLRLHHLPLALAVSYSPPEAARLRVGGSAIVDAKLAVAYGGHQRAAVGLGLGPEVELHLGRALPEEAWSPSLRFSLVWRLLRQRYVFDGGELAEAPWALGVACGVALP